MSTAMHLLENAPFGRVIPAMVTPMKSDGTVDYEAAQKLARHLVADGADGLLLNGTTGESPTTHLEEKIDIVRAVKEVVDVPVITGAGSNDTAHSVRMAEHIQEAGADALLIVAPYYSRPSQEGIYQHYKAVNDSSDVPIIIYDVPGRTGVKISTDTYVRMAGLSHVSAVKDATGDLADAVVKKLETGLAWYAGDDGVYVPFLSIGAVGIISVIAHVASTPLRRLTQAFDEGNVSEAQRIAVELSPLVSALNGDGFQAVMAKAACQVQGYLDNSTMRLPNVGPNSSQLDKARLGMELSHVLKS